MNQFLPFFLDATFTSCDDDSDCPSVICKLFYEQRSSWIGMELVLGGDDSFCKGDPDTRARMNTLYWITLPCIFLSTLLTVVWTFIAKPRQRQFPLSTYKQEESEETEGEDDWKWAVIGSSILLLRVPLITVCFLIGWAPLVILAVAESVLTCWSTIV